jgi:hypothetical protein
MAAHVLYADDREPYAQLHLTLESPRPGVACGRHINERACAAVLDEWLAGRGDRPLHDLVVSTTTIHHGDLRPVIDVLEARRPRVRRLLLGALTFPDFERGDDVPEDLSKDGSCWRLELPDLGRVFAALPDLEELCVQANDITSGYGRKPMAAPSLRQLALRGSALGPDLVAALGQGAFPALSALELWLGDYQYGWDGCAPELAPLLSAERLPALRRLTLPSDVADGVIDVLLGGSLLSQLETLDLSHGCVSDKGAARIREHWARFAHLGLLALRGNLITRPAAEALLELGPRPIAIGWQRWSHGELGRCALPAVSLFTGW